MSNLKPVLYTLFVLSCQLLEPKDKCLLTEPVSSNGKTQRVLYNFFGKTWETQSYWYKMTQLNQLQGVPKNIETWKKTFDRHFRKKIKCSSAKANMGFLLNFIKSFK